MRENPKSTKREKKKYLLHTKTHKAIRFFTQVKLVLTYPTNIYQAPSCYVARNMRVRVDPGLMMLTIDGYSE